MPKHPAYPRLEELFRKLSILGDTTSVLQWDMATMMPDGGAAARGEQRALLKAMAHGLLTAPEVPDLLDQAASETLDPWQSANLREMRRDWTHAAAVPAALVEALAVAEAACETVWREARPAADFARVRPRLDALLALVRETAAAKAEALGVSAYDALLDQYEPMGRAADIAPVFDALAAALPPLIDAVLAAQATRPAPLVPAGPFPVAAQKAMGIELMTALGFDFRHGRLDVSCHPFCGGTPEDVRITTRYDEDDFASGLMGVLHETGHALYDFGLPGGRWRHQPVGRARGMVMHESQSLLMEMQACRSQPFVAWAAPKLKAAFAGQGPAWEADNLHRLGLVVKRDFIRVSADEVTYPAHVIVRTRLEQALIAGSLSTADLPAAWNDGYRQVLGIVPPDDRLGCLQDIHWYCGAWGYFPTYTLGAMTAAQLFAAACAQVPGILPGVGAGDFRPLLGWLKEKIHGHGSVLSTAELVADATGRPLDPAVFTAHIRQRYLG
ncbi:MAG: carboxypeptidase M32 [Magnetospirillum sp.]|nr:carboxypeptidase M32 [Magnetospirillum sp.]